MLFFIVHGSYSSPESNWFPDLKEKLEALNQTVIAPAFPSPQNQSLEHWMKVFEKYLPTIRSVDKVCMIGHSLGPLFILHAIEKHDLKIDSAIFVSPFLEKLDRSEQIDIANATFYKKDFDFEWLKKLIPLSYTLYSDNDPYVEKKHSLAFAEKMGSSVIQVQKAGHMNAEINLNEFPLVYELCKSRIDLTLYQRFLEHRRELFAAPYTKGKTEEIIFLDPQEVQYEGIFHFRNLRRHGYATYYLGLPFWDSQSVYMQQARKAAGRVEEFVRVFVYDAPADLKKPSAQKQIKLDLASGMKLYSIARDKVLKITDECDFGIWDDEYRCLVKFDDRKQVQGVQLSSRHEDIAKAKQWMDAIIAQAEPITKL